ncbi:MAG: photosynthetic reaction center subunit H [Pseudomonadota bacterium]
MNEVGAITGYIDVAQLVLYLFWIFFFGLVFYLQKEGRREGFPLEEDDGTMIDQSWVWIPEKPKVFKVKYGPHKEIESGPRDTRKLALKKVFPWAGSPFEPTGDPMADGVGPASYAERGDHPDWSVDGEAKIKPLRETPDFFPAGEDNDPRGMKVFGADGLVAGVVSDIWVDKGEYLGRYVEVDLSKGEAGGEGAVLLPFNFMRVKGPKNIFATLTGIEPMERDIGVHVDAIRADQFSGVPKTKKPNEITLREEDMIMGYFGGGKLYAMPERMGPLI